jgi:hypothetical protein
MKKNKNKPLSPFFLKRHARAFHASVTWVGKPATKTCSMYGKETFHMYDLVVIGGGIAGMYTLYRVMPHLPPTARVVLLEGNCHLGGRTYNVQFRGAEVFTGAGFARKHNDTLLLQLLQDFRIPKPEYTIDHFFPPALAEACANLERTYLWLKSTFSRTPRKSVSFKAFAQPMLGVAAYAQFVTCAGYSDYEHEDAAYVFTKYDFHENYSKWIGFTVPWNDLFDRMRDHVAARVRFIANAHVSGTDVTPRGTIRVHVNDKMVLHGKRVVVATAVDSLRTIVPNGRQLYRHVHGQTFIHVYGQFSKACVDTVVAKVPRITVVDPPLQKILPINNARRVFMIAYSDNASADFLHTLRHNTAANRKQYCRMLEEALDIPAHTLRLTAIASFYWKCGTHYFDEGERHRPSLQHPCVNMFVVGEAISEHQGWVEGALETVEAILPLLIPSL